VVEHSIEIAVGEVLRIGDVRLVVVDIQDGEVMFRLEGVEGAELPLDLLETVTARLPR
jgi:hypothetical protein